jgi:DNA primase catalytic core
MSKDQSINQQRRLIAQIYQKTNLVDYVRQSVMLTYVSSRNTYYGLCPLHGEKTPSFHVSVKKNLFYCFGCKAGGNLIAYVGALKSVPYEKAIILLADELGITIEEDSDIDGQESPRKKIYETNMKFLAIANMFWQRFSLAEKENIETRIPIKYLEAIGVGLLPGHLMHELSPSFCASLETVNIMREGKYFFYNRLVFPIRNHNNAIVGFIGKWIAPGERPAETPKYLFSQYSWVFNKRAVLYGMHDIDYSNNKAIIVEGLYDYLRLKQYNYTNVLALLGSAFTDEHVSFIKKYFTHIILFLDGDKAGRQASLLAIWKILGSQFDGTIHISVVDDYVGDPCELNEREVQKMLSPQALIAFDQYIAKSLVSEQNCSMLQIMQKLQLALNQCKLPQGILEIIQLSIKSYLLSYWELNNKPLDQLLTKRVSSIPDLQPKYEYLKISSSLFQEADSRYGIANNETNITKLININLSKTPKKSSIRDWWDEHVGIRLVASVLQKLYSTTKYHRAECAYFAKHYLGYTLQELEQYTDAYIAQWDHYLWHITLIQYTLNCKLDRYMDVMNIHCGDDLNAKFLQGAKVWRLREKIQQVIKRHEALYHTYSKREIAQVHQELVTRYQTYFK